MEKTVLDLGFQRIAWTADTQRLAGRRAFGIRITPLDHEILNHAVEQRTIIVAISHQFHEVVTVDGSLVIQANHDIAQHCLYLYFHIVLIFECKGTE